MKRSIDPTRFFHYEAYSLNCHSLREVLPASRAGEVWMLSLELPRCLLSLCTIANFLTTVAVGEAPICGLLLTSQAVELGTYFFLHAELPEDSRPSRLGCSTNEQENHKDELKGPSSAFQLHFAFFSYEDHDTSLRVPP